MRRRVAKTRATLRELAIALACVGLAAMIAAPERALAQQCVTVGTNQTCTNAIFLTGGANGITDAATLTVTNTASGTLAGTTANVAGNIAMANGIFAVTADVNNLGSIVATATTIDQTAIANGILATNVTITNSGSITATASEGLLGIPLPSFTQAIGINATNGDVINSGNVSATTTGIGQNTNAFGIAADTVTNSGSVSTTATGLTGSNAVTNGISATTVTNSGTITATGTANSAQSAGEAADGVFPFALVGGIESGTTITVTNSGTISAVATATATGNSDEADGIFALTTATVTNSGTISANATAGATAAPFVFNTATANGIDAATADVNNSGKITATATTTGATATANGVFANDTAIVANSGSITVVASGGATGLPTFAGATGISATAVAVTNSGNISATTTGMGVNANASGINANDTANVTNSGSGTISANATGVTGSNASAAGISATTANVTNSGLITANATANGIAAVGSGNSAPFANASGIGATTANVTNSGTISANAMEVMGNNSLAVGIAATNANVTNSGRIIVTVTGTGSLVQAFGIQASATANVNNSGTIEAVANGSGASGVGIAVGVVTAGGFTQVISGASRITNTGTITGSTAAIDLTQEVGGTTTVDQAGGALIGDVKLSTNADVLNFSGGTIFNAVTAPAGNQASVLITGQNANFAPNASVSGVSAFTVSPGARLTLQVTPTQAPSINAGTIALAGTLTLAPQGNLFAFGAASHFYKNVFVADPPLSGNFANVNSSVTLFQASLSPDATTPNALDATLELSPSGLAASAQDLTQSLRLGLDAPQVLGQAVQNRLVASGGVLGEDTWGGGAGVKGLAVSSSPIGHANLWVRGADQFGTASGSGATPGYDVNRAAPFIGGVDWRLDNGIVLGAAATYVASSASFKDGSRTNVSSYQGAAYAGWVGGPWYATGSAVVSFNDFATTRLLTPFGLPGAATASPSGQSYAAHAEAGYRWLQAGFTVTPYAALDYVHASIGAFNETGGFGALSVNGATGNSFATTLGARATTRINWGDHAVLVPEVRIGWTHEFLDASQSLSASLTGVPGSGFSATGINFGRDSAVIGAGLSLELSPEAKVFVDYDGKFSQRLQEHAISGGLRLKF